MSRIGDKPIQVPEGVIIRTEDTFLEYPLCIKVTGPYGILTKFFLKSINVNQIESQFFVKNTGQSKTGSAYHGLARALIANMVRGVITPFTKTIIAEGVGYKFSIDKNVLAISVGFTHSVTLEIPSDLTIKVESPTKISIIGIDKEKVGHFSAKIRSVKPPEPYKGKGLMYTNEKVKRKAGKTRK